MTRALLVLFTVALVLAPRGALADEATAQLLYEEAKTLMGDGEHAKACPRLEKSLAIEEAMGARFLLAECYEKVGRYASAWTNYTRVAETASREGQEDRESFARKRAAEVRGKLATVVLVLAPATKALNFQVKRNGEPVAAALTEAPIPLDPGEHTFEVSAAGHRPFVGKVLVSDEPGQQELEVPALKKLPQESPGPEPRPDDGGLSALTIAGIAVGGAGVIGMAAAIAVAASAKGDYDQALEAHCVDTRCTPEGVEATDDARSKGNIGTIVFGVGAGLAATGAVLAIIGLTTDGDTAGDELAFTLSPTLDGGGMAVLTGRF